MRELVTLEKLKKFIREFAKSVSGPGKVYLTGGSTALYLGIREQTVDIDIRLDPEPKGAFEAIAELKERLNINVELASPADFIPPPQNWRENSIHIDTIDGIDFYHYDLYGQALAKIERGHDQDLSDVSHLLAKGHISTEGLKKKFIEIKSLLIRYPAISPEEFEKKLKSFVNTHNVNTHNTK